MELKAKEFIPYSHFHLSLIFAGKAGAYQNEAPYMTLLALPPYSSLLA
jgi:hypothetical protein